MGGKLRPNAQPLLRAKYYLFLTHHLLAASKQSDLRGWTKELGLIGFAKRGYPGVILLTALAEGNSKGGHDVTASSPQERLNDLSRRVKALRWASRDARPVQSLSERRVVGLQSAIRELCGERPLKEAPRTHHEILFLDSMKEVSALLRRADELAPTSSNGKTSALPTDEAWVDLWRREMKPS